MSHSLATFLMFEGSAEEAMNLYVSLFHTSSITSVERHEAGGQGKAGSIKVARFTVGGHEMMCSDSAVHHAFTFTPSVSLFVECESMAEQEDAFRQLSDGGQVMMALGSYGFSTRFGWVADRFGVSWQLNVK